MKVPLISIIIPTYKRVEYLERAIESAYNQSYSNLEILVIDDNNNEEISSKVKKIVEKYEKVIYIKNNGKHGGSGARNKGIESSKGEFIGFLDDDDEYCVDKIQLQYEYFRENEKKYKNLALIYCYALGVNIKKEVITIYRNDFEGIQLKQAMKGCIAGTSLWFIKKEAIVKIGGFINTPSKQDSMTIIKLLYEGYSIARVPLELIYYYEYENNKISGVGENAIKGNINLKNFCEKICDELGEYELKEEIENIYAIKLANLYLLNRQKVKAIEEIKQVKFSKNTIKSIIKFYIKWVSLPVYLKWLIKSREKRFN